VDVRSEKLGYKIREARMDKVPYMIIVGENEKNNMSVSVRQRDTELDKQDMGEMSLEHVVDLIMRGEIE
jgi:threonyl-tRNA synthetase